MIFAVALAAVVTVAVNLSGGEDKPAAPVALAESRATETLSEEREPEERNDLPRSFSDEPTPQDEPPPREERTSEEPTLREQALPIPSEDWTRPSREEVAAANEPRRYPSQRDAAFSLTMDTIGIYDAPVLNSTSTQALSRGVVHIPETPMPWDEGEQKNVYLAGHRVGSPGTGSHTIFYNLDKLSVGDSVVLEDRSGNAYDYRVSEVFVVEPDAGWVLDPVRDRDMVTLQTCTYPNFENRLIVRADRV